MYEVKEILESLGYKIANRGKYWQTSAVFRNGDNKTSLVIYPNDNLVIDFVESKKYSIEGLIAKTLGVNELQAKDYLLNNNVIIETREVPEIKLPKKIKMNDLINDYQYWNKRGINSEILKELKSGVCYSGDMKNRYVFPIFNSKMETIGKTGRDLIGKSPAKWKIIGSKSEFVYPAFYNYKTIKELKEVILVESIGCFLSLHEAGIKNGIVLFGTEISQKIINFLLAVSPERVIIATNNDSDFRDSDAGNLAATKIQSKLSMYFDSIIIKLPNKGKDFNEMLMNHGIDSIKEWYKLCII